MSYRIVRRILRWIFDNLMKVDIQGLELTPLEGPLLVTFNHMSIVEAPLLIAYLPRQPVSAVVKKEYQGTLAGKILLDRVRPVYIDRSKLDLTALRKILDRLTAGELFLIAPEGTRSKTGQLIRAKEGVAYLALRTGAKVLPVGMWGQEKTFTEWLHLRKPVIHVRFGAAKPISVDLFGSNKSKLEAGVQQIMIEIAKLLPPQYHGVYADLMQQEYSSQMQSNVKERKLEI